MIWAVHFCDFTGRGQLTDWGRSTQTSRSSGFHSATLTFACWSGGSPATTAGYQRTLPNGLCQDLLSWAQKTTGLWDRTFGGSFSQKLDAWWWFQPKPWRSYVAGQFARLNSQLQFEQNMVLNTFPLDTLAQPGPTCANREKRFRTAKLTCTADQKKLKTLISRLRSSRPPQGQAATAAKPPSQGAEPELNVRTGSRHRLDSSITYT